MIQFADPRIPKLLKSTQAAFPVSQDPWADLAHGLAATREEIATWVTDLQDKSVILGICAESNVHHPSIHESLEYATHNVEPTRWSAPTNEGILVSRWRKSAYDMPGWQANQWLKIGIMLDVGAEPENWDPFAPSTDRTMKPETPKEWSSPQDRIALNLDPLSILHRLDPRRPFWDSFDQDFNGYTAREAVQQLLINRLARRYALRLSPSALGWQGCGLACWSLDANEVERAAGALAAISCTGDVAIRNPTAEWPFNLSAVVLGHAPNSGQKTAAEISQRWKRDLGRWIEFQSLR